MPDRNRATTIIAAELERELSRPAAYAAAARIVAALDAAAEAAGLPYFAEGDIVQIAEGRSAGLFLVVQGAGPDGVDAYSPGMSKAYPIRYEPGELVHTGGRYSPIAENAREAAHGLR